MTDSVATRSGYLELIRSSPNFRNMWYGLIVSLLGDWFTLIGSATLIATLSRSGLAIGGLFIARMLPAFVLSPVTGVIADRFNRRALLIWSDVLRAIVVIGFLVVRRPEQIWLLYALTVLQLSISSLWQPTQSAILPEIVEPEQLVTANALISATWSTMLAFGAALGGLATGLIGIYPAFIIDAATYLVSAFFMLRIVYDAKPSLTSGGMKESFWQYVDGLRYLKGQPDVLVLALLKSGMAFAVGGGLAVVQVRYAERLFPLGEGGSISLGLMYAAVGVGTGLGPLVIRRLVGDRQRVMRWTIAGAYGLAAVGMAIVSFAPTLAVTLAGMTLRAIGGGIVWVFSAALLLLLLPQEMRGRVFAFEFAIFTLAYSISSGASGWLLDTSGWDVRQLALALGGALLIVGALWTLWLARRPSGQPSERAEALPSA
jgi:MFS family permease